MSYVKARPTHKHPEKCLQKSRADGTNCHTPNATQFLRSVSHVASPSALGSQEPCPLVVTLRTQASPTAAAAPLNSQPQPIWSLRHAAGNVSIHPPGLLGWKRPRSVIPFQFVLKRIKKYSLYYFYLMLISLK
jgi:hypothetical protein